MVTSGNVGQEGDFPPYSSLHDYVYMLLPPTSGTPEALIGPGSSFRAPYLLTTWLVFPVPDSTEFPPAVGRFLPPPRSRKPPGQR